MTSPRIKILHKCKRCDKDFYPLYASAGLYCCVGCSVRRKSEHHAWKGEEITYSAAHSYLRDNHMELKTQCTHCGSKEKLEFAKKTGSKYTRNVNDYLILCRKCHVRYDMTDEWREKSIAHLRSLHKKVENKLCKHCSKEFKPTKPSRIYCSNKCAYPYKGMNKARLALNPKNE